MPMIAAGCQPAGNRFAMPRGTAPVENESSSEIAGVKRDRHTLVMATAANYPPYEQLAESDSAEPNSAVATETERTATSSADGSAANGSAANGSAANSSAASGSTPNNSTVESLPAPPIVGFDIDVAELIAQRLTRQLTTVDLEFDALIPAVAGEQVDMVMAALEPRPDRKQKVDFSDIYYRSRQSLISIGGALRSPDLSYQSIGVRTGSVQARYANRLTDELSDLNIVLFDTLDEIFTALTNSTLAGAIVEATVATPYLRRYPDCGAQLMPSEQAMGSAIALPKDSPLRNDINRAITDIKTSGEMDRLIEKWFS